MNGNRIIVKIHSETGGIVKVNAGVAYPWNVPVPGDSAYQVWLSEGNTGTVQDYLDSLKGESGVITPDGFAGTDRDKIISAINKAVSTGINKIVINQDYTISRGIDIPSNFHIEVNGHLKLKQATVYNLISDSGLITSNLKTTFLGDYKRTDNRDYTLNDAAGLDVGEIISFFDDDFPKQFYPHTNRRSLVAVITAINGNVITIDRDFTNWLTSTPEGSNLFIASKNARIVPTDFVFRYDNKENITISGKGIIDGNRPYDGGILNIPNDVNNEPCNDEWNEEDYTLGAGCTIAGLNNSTNIVVKDVTVKGGFLHNFRYRYVNKFKILNTIIDDAHDKNLLLHYCDNGLVDGNEVKNSLFEDGIILYISNRNIKVNNNHIHSNPRYGFSVSRWAYNCTSSGNTMEFNGQNYYISSNMGFVSSNDVVLGGRMRAYRTAEKFTLNTAVILEGSNISFNNLIIKQPYENSSASKIESTGWKPMIIRNIPKNNIGVSKNITFNGGGMVNMWSRIRNTSTLEWMGSPLNNSEYLIELGGASNGQDYNVDGLSFNQFNFEGFSKGFYFKHTYETLKFSSIRFNTCTFRDSTDESLFNSDVLQADKAAVQFINCDNYLEKPYAGGVITNGQFLTDSGWTKGVGWTINTVEKRAECNGSQTSLTLLAQSGILEVGKTYRVKFKCIINTGLIRFRLGYSGQGLPRLASGTFTEDIVCSGNTQFDMNASADFIGSVTDISAIKLN